MVSTYQSFNKATNNINKMKVEQSLFGGAKSYMQAIATLRPVILIDEPHRFEGKQTARYLRDFNALFTMRFGATFKGEDYKNLIYTLDSIDAFSKGLVKAISVDTVGNESVENHTISFKRLEGSNQNNYQAIVELRDINVKNNFIRLKKEDNLGEKAELSYLNSYIVERITRSEIIFTNGISIPLGASEGYGVLIEEMQKVIVDTAIKNHFEREEELFKMNVKALCLFFIDRVDKYLTDDGANGELAILFEKLYLKNLELTLKKDNLDVNYKNYLLKTKDRIADVHGGYFAKSKGIKDEAEVIDLILNQKEMLLSFDSDLRFIFSQWALQEGWDNPNVMTLCKLAPSNSKISKLQQIGRGLRLAVDQSGNRITNENFNFSIINELFVVVPSTEMEFVDSIQKEIGDNSIKNVFKNFNEQTMLDNKIAKTSMSATRLLDALVEMKFIIRIKDSLEDMCELVISKTEYSSRINELEALSIDKCDNSKLIEYFDSFFNAYSRVREKSVRGIIKTNQKNLTLFKSLWDKLFVGAVIKYDIENTVLIDTAIDNINNNFVITEQDIVVQRDKHVESIEKHFSTRETIEVKPHTTFTLYEFLKALANISKLSIQTIAKVIHRIDEEKFKLISQNENLAIKRIGEQLVNAIYDTIINKISYELTEIKTYNTSLTEGKDKLKKFIPVGSLGRETYKITSEIIKSKSIYDEDFMEVDSKIEKTTIDESDDNRITVFGKLPRVNIPTAHGRHYNPDFGYVIQSKSGKELYFVVETKGYDSIDDIRKSEKLQISSAKAFFKELQKNNYRVSYKTKINKQKLSQMIGDLEQQQD